VAAPVAEALAGLRLVLWKRFRSSLGAWNPKPAYGCVFGSAARYDGDAYSDIDLLLVRAPVAGETDPRRSSAGLAEFAAGYASELMAVQLTARQASKWARQVEQLHELVPAWTGNPLQVVEMSTLEWADHRRRRTPLFTEIDRDAIQVAGETSLLRLLDLKDEAHYGVMVVAARKARDAYRWAARLVERAAEETER
jgi:hypothetical protein